MKKAIANILVSLFLLALIIVPWTFAPQIREMINQKNYDVQKVDDATNYKKLKEVEDTARAMISSYNSDKLKYDQYKDSEDKEKQSWAEQAKMRANSTASTYNNYLLKNSFVWQNNIPPDIYTTLAYLE